MRGRLTKEIKEISKKYLGREISQKELKLIPYVQYTCLNSRKINSISINREEKKILNKWDKKGWIGYRESSGVVRCSKKFWDFMSEVLYLAYHMRE
jgi:hypothetical protein